MEHKINSKFLMDVYSKIEKHGAVTKTEWGQGYLLDGVQVSAGFDGYELFFDNSRVQLTLGFHNTWHSNADSEKLLDEFFQQLEQIQKHYD
ncbi:DUF3081 family protein [Alkalimonas amylolytica]|uniref:DUF3081 domain-containing protein n=1 Tax=Alkalimonas amylolytica TaxID=152573 RepID=A0A1H3ZDY4_ALKAM|nr:DUF3081 family protein [Alkalimonas amylolytica]SEA21845.1 Protein of unknown function [Alkalimonas amylolytica]